MGERPAGADSHHPLPTSGKKLQAARSLGAAEHQREITKYVRWAPARDELAPVLINIEEACGKDEFEAGAV